MLEFFYQVFLHTPEQGAQVNRKMPHTFAGACRTDKPV
jgi:hypothetical protein